MKPKRYRQNMPSELPPKENGKKKKPFKWKQLGITVVATAVAYAILALMLELRQDYIWIVYELCAGLPLIAYTVVVRGRFGELPERDELPPEWSDAEKDAFLAEEQAVRDKGRPYLYFSVPFLMAILIGFIVQNWF